MLKILSIYSAIITTLVLSFDPSKICSKEAITVGTYDEYDRYKLIETKQTCSANQQYAAECGSDYCAADKQACREYLQARLVYKIFKLSRIWVEKLNMTETKLNETKNCSNSAVYTLTSSDVCVNRLMCLERTNARIENKDVRVFKSIKCKCRSSFSYFCGSTHCAVHKAACDTWLAERINDAIFNKQLKMCANFIII